MLSLNAGFGLMWKGMKKEQEEKENITGDRYLVEVEVQTVEDFILQREKKPDTSQLSGEAPVVTWCGAWWRGSSLTYPRCSAGVHMNNKISSPGCAFIYLYLCRM